MNPDNAWILRITAAAGTELADPYSYGTVKLLHNQTISVSLLKRLRSEQKFPSLDALKTQLLQDKNDTASFIASLR